MLVGDDVLNGNAVLAHELSGEAGGAVEDCFLGMIAVLAHFDADGRSISGPFVVGVLALFIGGKALVDGECIDREVPREVAERVVL